MTMTGCGCGWRGGARGMTAVLLQVFLRLLIPPLCWLQVKMVLQNGGGGGLCLGGLAAQQVLACSARSHAHVFDYACMQVACTRGWGGRGRQVGCAVQNNCKGNAPAALFVDLLRAVATATRATATARRRRKRGSSPRRMGSSSAVLAPQHQRRITKKR